MTAYSKYNIVYRLQKWMDSVPGQTFLNYAYSWGASIVILGTLFKLTHLPGANFFLFLGMGTEVFVFFISAFDRPFDKTADGRDLPTHLVDETTDETYAGDPTITSGQLAAGNSESGGFGGGTMGSGMNSGGFGGGTIIIGGGTASAGGAVPSDEQQDAPAAPVTSEDAAIAAATQHPATAVQGAWVAQQNEVTPQMAEAQSNYVDALNDLTEMLSKVSEQSMRLTRDSEEMENLNRTLTGICKVYEMQLKSVSSQIGTIDQINDQTKHMAQQIAELNKIYDRMIKAMTVNMPAAAAGLSTPNNDL